MKLPQAGEILSYSLSDAVGRIRLDDGSELRFGATCLHGLTPAVGLRVIVASVAPHPLGGYKATVLSSAERDDAAYREKVAAFETAAVAEIESTRPRIEEEHRLIRATIHPAPLTDEEAAELAERKALREADERAQREAVEKAELLQRETRLRLDGRTGSAAWSAWLEKVGLKSHDATRILALERPAALLVAMPSDSLVVLGASKLGGEPDLSEGFPWPRFKERPLSFLAQLRLSEAPARVRESLALPHTGLLSFFYDAEEQPWGFDPADAGAAVVCFSPDVERLVRVAAPPDLPDDGRFRELAIHVREETSLPGVGSPALDELALDQEAIDAYLTAIDAFHGANETTAHFLGGYAAPIQDAMEEECALVTHGIHAGNQVDRSQPGLAPIVREARDWRLLLQLDSDELMGTLWGDAGRLYFWIREDDLRARAFGNAWCVLQCY